MCKAGLGLSTWQEPLSTSDGHATSPASGHLISLAVHPPQLSLKQGHVDPELKGRRPYSGGPDTPDALPSAAGRAAPGGGAQEGGLWALRNRKELGLKSGKLGTTHPRLGPCGQSPMQSPPPCPKCGLCSQTSSCSAPKPAAEPWMLRETHPPPGGDCRYLY